MARIGDKIEVQWDSTSPYSYDYFILRWDRDDHSENVAEQHKDDGQQQDVKTSGTEGQSLIDATAKGLYVIYVEGCVKSGFIIKSASCNQGWSFPIYVDQLPALQPPVPLPPQPPPVTSVGILDIPDPTMIGSADQNAIVARLCGGDLLDHDGDHKGEVTISTALAQLRMINRTQNCGFKSAMQLRTEVNDAFLKAVVVSQPGTDVSGLLQWVVGLVGGTAAGAIAGALLGVALTAVFGGLAGSLKYLPVGR